MSNLLEHCHGEKTHFSRNEKEQLVSQQDGQSALCYWLSAQMGARVLLAYPLIIVSSILKRLWANKA